MNQADLAAYLDRSQSLIEDSPQMGEENTKVRLIQPLIELLGWDLYSSEVELEYPMQIGRGNTRADYALQIEDVPVVFIEAKGCDSTLTESDRIQLSSYMRQKGVDWGLLTNGNEFEVLKRRTESDRPEEVTLGQFSLDELAEHWSIVRLLSKELVMTGEADTIAERMEARQHAVRTLREDKEVISERVTQLVIDEVGETLTQEIESASKAFVDGLIESLDTDGESEVSIREPKSMPDEEDGYEIMLIDGDITIQSFTDENQSDVMARTVDYLIQQHDLLDTLESFPYVPGKKNAILNSEPKHPSGDEMVLYRELPSGYYLFVSLSRESKKRYVKRFSEWCGLKVKFDGEW